MMMADEERGEEKGRGSFSVVTSSLLDCKVEGYERKDGDGGNGESHLFVIRVWCERVFTYVIKRSAAQCYLLSTALKKRFPKAGLEDSPLCNSVKPRQGLGLGGAAVLRDAFVGDARLPSKVKRAMFAVADAEDRRSLAYVRLDLERWLRDLLTLAEVVASEEMIAWLSDDREEEDDEDEDAFDRFKLMTRVDFALAEAPVERLLVKHGKSQGIELVVPSGYFVVWSFCSRPRDIAFTLILMASHKAAREYERVPSHQRLCQGIWQNTGDNTEVMASWGNEYAKWRDKRIFYQLAVVSPTTMEASRERHTRYAEREAEREAHRQALERVARKLAARQGLLVIDTESFMHRTSSTASQHHHHHHSGMYHGSMGDHSDVLSALAENMNDEKHNHQIGLGDDDTHQDDTESIRSSYSQQAWPLMPVSELRAALQRESQRAASLESALFLAEKEATTCRLARDDACSRATDAEKSQRTLSSHLSTCRSKLQNETEIKTNLENQLDSYKKQLAESQQNLNIAVDRTASLEKRTKALERERDLLAQAVQSYRDSAELARGDARSVRDELQHARDQLVALNQNTILNGNAKKSSLLPPPPLLSGQVGDADFDTDLDDSDDLLRRVDALQSRIDSELSQAQRAALTKKKQQPSALQQTTTREQDSPLPDTVNHDPISAPPSELAPPTLNDNHTPSALRRHDLVVPDGFKPGDILPFVAEGLDLSVAIPADLQPGDVFTIELR